MTDARSSDPWLTPQAHELRDRTRAFVRDVVLPAEARAPADGHGPPAALRDELQAAARASGLLAPTVASTYGGLGLDVRAQTAVLEEAGYSLLGPPALNCAAPDEGNMHLLEVVGSDEQKERLLRPLARGDVRSAFAMSEPPPGAGSDPSALRTEARRVPGGWSISGRKRFITGADGAAFAICMARTDDELAGDRGASMFIVEAANPGMRIERRIATIDSSFAGGHAELVFDDCRVGDDDVLGEVGLGFRLAQARLAPARLTHCMRWLGLARRSLDVALDYAAERELFGAALDQSRHRPGADRRLRDRPRGLPGPDPPRRGSARRRRARAARVGGRKGVRGRGGRPRGRSRHAAVRRARHVGRPAARTLRGRAAPLPRVRRPLRDAPDGDRTSVRCDGAHPRDATSTSPTPPQKPRRCAARRCWCAARWRTRSTLPVSAADR